MGSPTVNAQPRFAWGHDSFSDGSEDPVTARSDGFTSGSEFLTARTGKLSVGSGDEYASATHRSSSDYVSASGGASDSDYFSAASDWQVPRGSGSRGRRLSDEHLDSAVRGLAVASSPLVAALPTPPRGLSLPLTRVGSEESNASKPSESQPTRLDWKQLNAKPMETQYESIFSKARHNKYKEVADLFDTGAHVDGRDSFGNTVLHIACQNGHKRMAKCCLRRMADVNAQNLRGQTPLHFCFAFGYQELGQYLIERCFADINVRNVFGLTPHEGLGLKTPRKVDGDDA